MSNHLVNQQTDLKEIGESETYEVVGIISPAVRSEQKIVVGRIDYGVPKEIIDYGVAPDIKDASVIAAKTFASDIGASGLKFTLTSSDSGHKVITHSACVGSFDKTRSLILLTKLARELNAIIDRDIVFKWFKGL